MHLFGDVAYANGNQYVWDAFARDMEPLYARVPALLSPGNHDGELVWGNTYTSAGEGGGDSGVVNFVSFFFFFPSFDYLLK